MKRGMAMRLTSYTDYSLRVLITLASMDDNKKINIQDIAAAYRISKNHLMKVVHRLGQLGVIETSRGRGGGIRLKMTPEAINIGWLVRQTEDDFQIVECFDKEKDACLISPVCIARGVFAKALDAYLSVLDQYTLYDITTNRLALSQLFMQAEENPN